MVPKKKKKKKTPTPPLQWQCCCCCCKKKRDSISQSHQRRGSAVHKRNTGSRTDAAPASRTHQQCHGCCAHPVSPAGSARRIAFVVSLLHFLMSRQPFLAASTSIRERNSSDSSNYNNKAHVQGKHLVPHGARRSDCRARGAGLWACGWI